MPRHWSVVVVMAIAGLLTACGGGMVRRVSEPAASIQQLTVNADGSWSVLLRLQNYSSIPMRFDTVQLDIEVGEHSAGKLQASPQLSIGPESADVITVPFTPTSEGRIVLADALAGRRSLAYELEGKVEAVPEEGKTRSFDIDTRNTLSPVPGLDGVLR